MTVSVAEQPSVRTARMGPPAATYRKWGRESWVRRAPLLPALVFLIVVTQVPFVATLVDVTGIVIYFEVAARVLRGTLL